jgi:hypothetical protein
MGSVLLAALRDFCPRSAAECARDSAKDEDQVECLARTFDQAGGMWRKSNGACSSKLQPPGYHRTNGAHPAATRIALSIRARVEPMGSRITASAAASCSVGSRLMITSWAPARRATCGKPAAG